MKKNVTSDEPVIGSAGPGEPPPWSYLRFLKKCRATFWTPSTTKMGYYKYHGNPRETFILRGFPNPHIENVKPSFFHGLLGSKGMFKMYLDILL